MSTASTRAFSEHVKGQLKARFRLDPSGNPIHEEDDGLRHYVIDLSLEAAPAVAERIDNVTYYLDEGTYEDPVVASNHRYDAFTSEISTYGDFEVDVTVQMGKHAYKQRALLSDLLEAGHASDSSEAIRKALDYVKRN